MSEEYKESEEGIGSENSRTVLTLLTARDNQGHSIILRGSGGAMLTCNKGGNSFEDIYLIPTEAEFIADELQRLVTGEGYTQVGHTGDISRYVDIRWQEVKKHASGDFKVTSNQNKVNLDALYEHTDGVGNTGVSPMAVECLAKKSKTRQV